MRTPRTFAKPIKLVGSHALNHEISFSSRSNELPCATGGY
jgi:hypothetical protein